MPSLDSNLLSNRHFTSPDIFNKALNSLSFTLLFGKMHRATHGSPASAFTHHTPWPSDPRVILSKENRENGGAEKSCTSEPVQAEPRWLRVQRSSRPERPQESAQALRPAGGLSICQGIWPLHAISRLGTLKMDMDMAAPGDTRSLPPYFIGARCPQPQLLREGSGWPPPLCLRQVAQRIPPPFSSVSWDSSFSKCFLFCRCFILLARRAP